MYSDWLIQEITPLAGPIAETPHPDGQGLVALSTVPGTYKSLHPQGGWNADASSAGSWERFFPYGGGWFAYRDDSKRLFFVSRIPKLPYMP